MRVSASVSKTVRSIDIEERSKKSASMLWQSLPPVYRLCTVCYTDFWEYYSEVLPFKRQRLLGKESGKTSHNERLNNTLRQRIYRLVRKTLSFSKNCFHHIGALFNCGPHYNFCIRKRYPYCVLLLTLVYVESKKLDYHYYAGLPKYY
ncbi:IS1 family transposase [Microcoleus sp. Pol14D4]